MDWLPIISVTIGFIILALASWSDWKTREASDFYWVLLGTLGLILLAFEIGSDDVNALYYLFLIPLAVFFYDIFWERKGVFEDGINALPLVMYVGAFGILALLIIRVRDRLILVAADDRPYRRSSCSSSCTKWMSSKVGRMPRP